MGSPFLTHLPTAWHVDQSILSEELRLVVLRFGSDSDPECMRMDEHLCKSSTSYPPIPYCCFREMNG